MNNDTEVPILMYLYFDIVGSLGSTVALTSQQKTLTELLEVGRRPWRITNLKVWFYQGRLAV